MGPPYPPARVIGSANAGESGSHAATAGVAAKRINLASPRRTHGWRTESAVPSVGEHAVKAPAVGHALERVLATVLEDEAGSGSEILDRRGCQHL
jgi:hypothetical protein